MKIIVFVFTLAFFISCKKETTTTEETVTNIDTIAKKETHKIVSLNSAVTEIVAALGHEGERAAISERRSVETDLAAIGRHPARQ